MKNLLPALTVIGIILLVSCSKSSPTVYSSGSGSWTFGSAQDSGVLFQNSPKAIQAHSANGRSTLSVYANGDSLPTVSGTYALGPLGSLGITLLSNDSEYVAVSNSPSQKINLSISGNQITMSGSGLELSGINNNDSSAFSFSVTTTY